MRLLIGRLAAGVLLAGLIVIPASASYAAPACEVTYRKTWDSGSGFGASITIRNTGDPLTSWRLSFSWPGNQRIEQGWSATWSQSERFVTAQSLPWNGNLGTGATREIGFNGRYSGTNTNPFDFSVNGVPCNGLPPPPPATRADNPYAGASGYVNPARRERVNAEAANQPEPLAGQMRAVGQQPTAVWLDRIAAISGLAGHLDAAVSQDAANGTAPVAVTLVLYNLPDRNCPLPPGSSELTAPANGLSRYQSEYIDPIRTVLARSQYANLRVAVMVEPWSLATVITHQRTYQWTPLRCVEAHDSNVYQDGIRYAVSQLGSLPNTYLYLDASHSGWFGYDTNLSAIVNLYDQILAPGSGGPGYGRVSGLVTNVAGYVPVEEVFLPNPDLTVSGTPIWTTRFPDFNKRFDEKDYVVELRNAFVSRGCTGCGILIDTSRNGWGGPNRPTQLTVVPDANQYVNLNRLDRRQLRINWCNQVGAGIGIRPTADTGITGVDAFVWVKPPGESDGISVPDVADPDDPNLVYERMCGPNEENRYDDEFRTGAMAGAPHFGRWFPAQFTQLVQNAYPPIN